MKSGESNRIDAPQRTPLYSWHAAHGARIVPFGGWEMPVQYTSIIEEHTATRTAAGVFDISHMGRINFVGPAAAAFLDRLLTISVRYLKPGQIRYSLVVNESGGVLDDVLVYRTPAADHTDHMLVVNASNRQKMLEWIGRHSPGNETVEVQDRTFDWGMIAVQGPRALEIVQPLVKLWLDAPPASGLPATANARLDSIPYYRFAGIETCGTWGIVSRTGYTGEDGVELIVPADREIELWERVVAGGEKLGLKPCGLGARDTLRLEAAMPLYGHELDEQTNPLEAGLGFAIDLDKPDFIGKSALIAAKQAGLQRRRVGIVLEGKRIAREGMAILHAGQPVGRVTSGTFGPTVQQSIAMGYVPSSLRETGTELAVDIRGQAVPATVVKLPFYKRPRR
ncbi:MAG: glycine cleavage system aminomethyltransferase GcvT [Planctomycetes bacterium]|nr:glycine cleavage system aminomethyltransferase GcvT [Planctomycetota bacterium]